MTDFSILNGYNVKDAVARPLAINNSSNIWKNALKGFIAHRGFGYSTRYICANTELAVSTAFANGFTGVEIDIQYDKDNNIVCFHDDTLDATTDKTGYMSEYSYTDVHLINTVTGLVTGYTPALLSKVLRLCRLNGTFPYIDFKYVNGSHVAYSDVITLLRQYGIKYYGLRITEPDFPTVRALDENAVLLSNNYAASGLTEAQAQALKEIGGDRVGVYLNMTITDAQKIILDKYNIYAVSSNVTNSDAVLGSSAPHTGNPIIFDSGWILPEVNSPMSTPGDTYRLKYRRINNTVYVVGKVTGFTTDQNVSSNALPIFNLPVSFRPQYNLVFQNAGANSTQSYIYSTMAMPNGNVRIVRTNAPLTSQTNDGLYINMVFAVAG